MASLSLPLLSSLALSMTKIGVVSVYFVLSVSIMGIGILECDCKLQPQPRAKRSCEARRLEDGAHMLK